MSFQQISANKINLPFITDGWTIELSKIPKYPEFDGEFIESLDYPLLQQIYDSEELMNKPEIKSLLKNILNCIDKNTGELKVVHNQRYKCGRYYADNDISLIPLSKYIKHTAFKYLGWLDIDWVKGHPSIAIEMGKSIGISFPTFEKYVNEFDDIVKTLSEFYTANLENPLKKDNIKWLFCSMIYGGGFKSWANGVQSGDENYEPVPLKNSNIIHPIIDEFKKECEFIADKIYRDNKTLRQKVGEKKTEIYKKKSSTCSYWFQIIENHIVYMVAEFLIERGILKPKRYGLEYDGLNIPPVNIDDKDGLIKDVNQFIKLRTNMNITFKFKDYDDDNVLYNVIEKRKQLTDIVVNDSQLERNEIIEEYEMNEISQEILNIIHVSSPENLIGGYCRGCGDVEIARILYFMYKDKYVCVSIKDNLWYKFENHRWVKDESGTSLRKKISHELRDEILKVSKNLDKIFKSVKNNEKFMKGIRDKIVEIILRLSRTTDKKNVMVEAKEFFYDENFEKKLDKNLNLMCFSNGIFDFKNLQFRDGFPEDMCSLCTNVPFEPFTDEEMIYLNDVKQRVFYNTLGKDVADYLILQIGRALAGERMKKAEFCLGDKDGGKSTVSMGCKAFGDYAGYFNAENLAYRNTSQDEAQIMRWALLLRNKRIIFSNEIKSKVELNGNMIKKLSSGGDTLIGRNHCQGETEFVPNFLMFCMSNDLPKISPYDNAVSTRVRVIPFNKTFVDNPTEEHHLKKDPNLSNEMETDLFKRAFVGIIIQRYIEFVDGGRIEIEPPDVFSAKKEWLDDDGSEYKNINKFLEDYDITDIDSDYVLSEEIEMWLEHQKLEISHIVFTRELKKYCLMKKFEHVKSNNKKIGNKVKKAWYGIRKIIEIKT